MNFITPTPIDYSLFEPKVIEFMNTDYSNLEYKYLKYKDKYLEIKKKLDSYHGGGTKKYLDYEDLTINMDKRLRKILEDDAKN